jgi:hypothetical protein
LDLAGICVLVAALTGCGPSPTDGGTPRPTPEQGSLRVAVTRAPDTVPLWIRGGAVIPVVDADGVAGEVRG